MNNQRLYMVIEEASIFPKICHPKTWIKTNAQPIKALHLICR